MRTANGLQSWVLLGALLGAPIGANVSGCGGGSSVTSSSSDGGSSSTASSSDGGTDATSGDAGSDASDGGGATSSGLQVKGNRILLNGQPFVPHGFNMIGLLTPPGCSNGDGIRANEHFGQAEMDAAKAWKANTLRFQISQPGLVGSNATEYLNEVVAGVKLVVSNGFEVILSMQDQSIGCGPADPLPSAQTVAAWHVLAPMFAGWFNVAFELFNEPQNGEGAADWAQWKDGGSSPINFPGVGMQQLVDDIRALGANNVLLADGGSYAESLQGVPLLTDKPGGRGIAYAVHPYYFSPGESEWQSRYGYLTPTVPVVATEWNYKSTDCGSTPAQIAPMFLQYLQNNDIGMTAMAFDFPPLLTTDAPDATVWQWLPNECGTSVGGPGVLLQNWFKSQ